ncbi:hypothetical protein ACHAXM_004750 [Skeletonema potamos]
MKAFLLDFFGLSSCLKDDAVDYRMAVSSQHHNERRQEVVPPRRIRSRPQRRREEPEEERQPSYYYAARRSSKRSLPQIDEKSPSPLQRSNNSSRHGYGSGSGSIGSCNSFTQRRPLPTTSTNNGPNTTNNHPSNNSSGNSIVVRNKNVHRKQSSLSNNRYHGRDDPATLGLSLSETMGHSHDKEDDGAENDEFLDEQSAIRRSFKDQNNNNNNMQQSQALRRKHSPRKKSSSSRSNSNSQRSKLESFIDKREEKSPLNKDDNNEEDDFDNVTTISKASINPYHLLNISQSASPRDVYRGYRRKMKETEKDGGGEKAFRDVGNAYRRIRAEIKRQERRRVEQPTIRTTTNNSNNMEAAGGSRRRIERVRSSKSSKSNGGYRQRRKLSISSSSSDDDDEESISSRATAIGARLKDHRELVKGLFANDNKVLDRKSSSNGSTTGNGEVTSLQNAIYSQSRMIAEMNLVPLDAGATNINEKNETITNSCFYLSLAASYLCGVGAFTIDPTVIYSKRSSVNNDTNQTIEMDVASLPKKEKQLTNKLALQLKRAIEAAVVLVHPDWAASGMVGEEVQAFSDFLVYALDSDSVLGHWSIAIFDEASGFVDVYRGRHYGKIYPPTKVTTRNGREKLRYKDCDVDAKRANTLTLRYIPGHYQPLLPELTKMGNERRKARKTGKVYDSGLQKRATLEDILELLKKWNVLHVVTDGRA